MEGLEKCLRLDLIHKENTAAKYYFGEKEKVSLTPISKGAVDKHDA